MIRLRYSDLVFELGDICKGLKAELQQHLLYYRASAYKDEAIREIDQRVDQLRAIFQILADSDLNEAMSDHDAVWGQGHQLCGVISPRRRSHGHLNHQLTLGGVRASDSAAKNNHAYT